ncbi:MAG: phage holin family protein [Raoultibacter sp.]
MNFLIRWLGIAIAVGVAVWLVPGIEIVGGTESWIAIAVCALFLALINQTIRPIMQLLSLPISVLTLGIFALIINTFMLYLAQWLANGIFQVGFVMDTFGSAFVASIVISIVSAILNGITGANAE